MNYSRNVAENSNKKYSKSKSKSKRPRDLKDDDRGSRMTPPPDKPTVDVR